MHNLLRPLLIASTALAFAGATVWSAAGMVNIGGSLAAGSGFLLPGPQIVTTGKQPRLPEGHGGAAQARKLKPTARPVVAASLVGHAKSTRQPKPAQATEPSGSAARFDAIARQADLTSEKLASLFNHAATTKSSRRVAKASAPAPAPERFAARPAPDRNKILLAYADPSPSGGGSAALAALLAPPPESLASQAPDDEGQNDALAVPDFEDTPSDVPLPQLRPGGDLARKPAAETQKPEIEQAAKLAAPRAEETDKAETPEAPRQQKLTAVRPDNPEQRPAGPSLGQTIRNLFGGSARTRAGSGVAVYDISAAKVYMPDGSVLEAHSGVGKMADDARYVHVKMNGPTPPHTYNLKMREQRFHGVEAIRMLPVDGKNKYGRDGFLTHSYLLRGRQAESHGCVAFKDYNRFLNAFKQGKVRQLVVVPSGGRATMFASNG